VVGQPLLVAARRALLAAGGLGQILDRIIDSGSAHVPIQPVGRGNPDSSCCELVILMEEAAQHIATPDLSRVDLR
jgi:hypothetical protein